MSNTNNISNLEKEKNESKLEEAFFERIFESLPNPVVVFDRIGNIITANSLFTKLYSDENTNMVLSQKKNFRDFIESKDRLLVEQSFVNSILNENNTNEIQEISLNLLRKDSTSYPAEIKLSRIANLKNNNEYFIASIVNLTSSKVPDNRIANILDKFHSILDAFYGFVYVCSEDYEIEYANKTLIERTGFNPVGKKCYEAIHGLNTICSWCVNQRIFNGETLIWEIESPKDKKWFHIVNTPIIHPDGKKSKFSLFHDITNIKRAEEVIRESEEKYCNLVELANDGICIFQDNVMRFFNSKMIKILGYTSDEINEKKLTDFVYINDREFVENKIKSFNSSKEDHQRYECLIVNKSGQLIDVDVNISSIMYEKKRAALVIVRDITEKKIAEKKLQESEKKYRHLYNSSQVGLFKSNFLDGSLILFNEAIIKMLGLNNEDLNKIDNIYSIKNKFLEQYSTDPDKRQKFVTLLLEKGYVKDLELEFVGKNNELVNVLLNAKYYPEDQTIEGSIVDISNLKMIENELKLAKIEAEQSNQLKSIFLTNVSHELRTPLNGILGFCQLMLKLDFDPNEMKNYISKIYFYGKGLLDIINNVLELSRIESGKVIVEKECVNLKELFSNINSLAKIQILGKDIKLEMCIEITVPAIIYTDVLKLNQILVNLMGNAIKFTEKGSITLSVSKEHSHYLKFSIQDSGIGIPKERHSVIFDPFIQADNSLSRKHGGTGLGLSISKNFVKMLGGDIWFESDTDNGSTFHFTIDISGGSIEESNSKKVAQTQPVEDKNDLPKLNSTILIVEDDISSSELLKIALKNICNSLLIANTGEEAMQIIKSQSIDLVLMDIQLPLIDGLELTNIIRNTYNLKTLPIIATTAFAMKGDRERFLNAGCTDYIAKPIDLDYLFSVIRKYINS